MLEEWLILIVPVVAYFVTQAAKLAFDGIKGNMDVWHMWTMYGGMPSAHSAFVISLALYLGLSEGFTSPHFALAVVFGIITMRDAMGIRMQIGKQATVINQLMEQSPKLHDEKDTLLNEKLGHTPLEVFVGAVFGACIALLGYYFI